MLRDVIAIEHDHVRRFTLTITPVIFHIMKLRGLRRGTLRVSASRSRTGRSTMLSHFPTFFYGPAAGSNPAFPTILQSSPVLE